MIQCVRPTIHVNQTAMDPFMDATASPAFADHLQQLQKRWEDALANTGYDLALVSAGNPENYLFDDMAPPFRPNPHFAQWFPQSDSEHCELLVQPGSKPTVLFFSPEDFWHMPPSLPEWAQDHFNLHRFDSVEALRSALAKELAGHNNIAQISGSALDAGGIKHNPADLLAELDYTRARKTDFEIANLRASTARGVAGHTAAQNAFEQGHSEYDIFMAFLAATRHTADELPYRPIVALNTHAGVLHYQHYDQAPPSQAYSFLIDAGAAVGGYASDITRTYAGPAAPSAFVELIKGLDQAQQELINDIQIGDNYANLHLGLINTLAELLCGVGVFTCSITQAQELQLADPFMPHGLGHLIGLQTHDVGGHQSTPKGDQLAPGDRFPALRLTRDLAQDSVFTIEPGIYFIASLLEELKRSPNGKQVNWALIEELMPCGGIRIEDNVWLSAQGPINLTRDAFEAVNRKAAT